MIGAAGIAAAAAAATGAAARPRDAEAATTYTASWASVDQHPAAP
ncbi:hypothetical protein [Dactylosporangium sp. NPDC049140]